MQRIFNIVVPIVAMLFISSSAYSQDSIKVVPRISDEDIEINYLQGAESDNLGLKISAAYQLGERKSKKAVIPLMKVLRNDSVAEARIMAALSLYKIGDERGIFAIKKAMEFDEDKQVKQMCSIFYQMYLTDTKTKKE